MGFAIAKELHNRGAEVTLILGPTDSPFEFNGLRVKRVQTASEMYDVATQSFEEVDIAVMAAAVADYTPLETKGQKIKKSEDTWALQFIKTKDILKKLGEMKRQNQVLVGFALETNNEKENALDKLKRKNADMIILNSMNDAGAGFGFDTNKITILTRTGKEWPFETKSKQEVARDIVDTIINQLHG
jgi:phosphopantothenoylcysteine decarboxylase/phosphopantothenate--cysteine ligase